MRQILSGVIIVFTFAQLRCNDKGIDVQPPKDPRDYTWTVDTLIANPNAVQTEMWDIYATSPQNVYVVGHTDWTGVNGNGIMWRYDGTSWSIVNDGFRDCDLESITGFGPSDIYAAGNKGPDALILHFDGSHWTQTILPGGPLFTIRGSSPSDIWAGGWMGTVFRFDGIYWKKIDMDQSLNFKDFAEYDGKAYTIAYRVDEQPQDTIWDYSLAWDGTRWDTIGVYLDLSLYPSESTFGTQSLSDIDDVLYSAGTPSSSGSGLFQLVLGRWAAAPGNLRVAKVFGTSSSNIFGVGSYGAVYHYNGSNWFQFEDLKSEEFRYIFWSGWTDGREAFVVGNDGNKSYVLHGK